MLIQFSPKFDAGDLLGQERLADVRAEVAHAGDGPQLAAGRGRSIRASSGSDVPGLVIQCIEEVALLERREAATRPSGGTTSDAGQHRSATTTRYAGRGRRMTRDSTARSRA